MTPVQLPTTNLILTAPKNSEDTIMDLPVTKYSIETPDGVQECVMSGWQLSPEELEYLNNHNGIIYFHTYGNTHPPIMLTPLPLEALKDVETE